MSKNLIKRISFTLTVMSAPGIAYSGDLPIKEICPANKLDPVRFAEWLLTDAGIPIYVIHRDKSSLLEMDEIKALINPDVCPPRLTPDGKLDAKGGPCGEYRQKQLALTDRVKELLGPEESDNRNSFRPKSGYFQVKRNATPAPADPEEPGGELLREPYTDAAPLNEILHPYKQYYVVSCVEKAPSIASVVSKAPDMFRLRSRPEDLVISRNQHGGKDFKSIKAADLGIKQDHIKHRVDFDINATVGYVAPDLSLLGVTIESIPFAKYKRQYIGGVKRPNDSNTHNIGVGSVEHANFGIRGSGLYNDVSLVPQFVSSIKSGAKIGKVDASWEPQPNIPWFAHWYQIDSAPFDFRVYADGKVSLGHVFESGGQSSLSRTSNFLRSGPEVGIAINGIDVFEGFSINTFYRDLITLSGQFDRVPLFQSTLAYQFTSLQYVSLDLSYNAGRDPDTFEKQKYWKLGLGVKF